MTIVCQSNIDMARSLQAVADTAQERGCRFTSIVLPCDASITLAGERSLDPENRRAVDELYTPNRDAVEPTGVCKMEMMTWPKCRKCSAGDLVPLSDYGTEGASVMYKAWVCTNPSCGFNLKIHKGNLYINEPVNERPNYSHSS